MVHDRTSAARCRFYANSDSSVLHGILQIAEDVAAAIAVATMARTTVAPAKVEVSPHLLSAARSVYLASVLLPDRCCDSVR